MDSQLAALNIAKETQKTVFRVIDRRDKLPTSEWKEYALGQGLSAEQVEGILRIQSDTNLWQESEDLRRVFAILEKMGLSDYVEFDPEVIRGLDYYTGVVFEAQARSGGRAIFGGGHYDNLVAAVGGDPLPGVGFAMGDMMITIILGENNLLPELKLMPAETFVTVFDEEGLPDAFALANELRLAGMKVVANPEASKLQKQLKYADRVGVRYVLIAGPDERAAGQVTVKDLLARSQETVDRARIVEVMREKLAQPAAV
jgi:histidyl-tRNA synthetase